MGLIHDHLAADHARLAALLDRATARPGEIDPGPFDEFRRGLLRHIGMEEKILFPAARRAGLPAIPWSDRLRADHARLTALLVPTPTPAIALEIRATLARHDQLEEGEGGAYEACERVVDAAGVLERLRAAPEVPVRPHQDRIRPTLLDD